MCNDTEAILAELSVPGDQTDEGLSRRRFLQLTAAGASAATVGLTIPGGSAAFAGPPLGGGEGVLVCIQLSGGNDGLNTIAPVDDGNYQSLRGGVALDPGDVLRIDGGLAMHPALTGLKGRYDRGDVAVIQGIGYGSPSLSHFDGMAFWMHGKFGASPGTRPHDGWLGRHLDAKGNARSDVEAVVFDSGVPLHLVGRTAQAIALRDGDVSDFGVSTESHYRRMYNAIDAMAAGASQMGQWGVATAEANQAAIDFARQLAPAYEGPNIGGSSFNRQMGQAARLINADIGVRVLSVNLGGFDNHSGLEWRHNQLMQNLDTGIETFFRELQDQFQQRVVLMTFSEFGRRVRPNGAAGTDHGTASVAMVIGSRVKGGLKGAYSSLTALDSRGNLRPEVDFRALYGSVVQDWLKGDGEGVVGGRFDRLDLFGADPDATAVRRGAPNPLARHGYLLVTAAGGVHNFGKHANYGSPWSTNTVAARRHPTKDGYWVATSDGSVYTFGEVDFFGSLGGTPLNAPIVDMAVTPSGRGYWLLGGDGGVFTFGDADFFGSTGNLRLNRPVVGMAPHPGGRGYWFCASDGGIFTYGAANFHGSTGAMRLNRPVVGMAAHPSGKGYWLVADDGGIFTFGRALFYGSTGNIRLAQPIIGMASTPSGKGYWLIASDGGVFTFGDATFQGSLGGVSQTGSLVGIAV